MAKNIPIEKCFEIIERAIDDLEDGELPLEQSLKVYESGLSHVRLARGHLDAFAKRLEAMRALEEEALGEQDAVDEDHDDDDDDMAPR